MLGSVRFVIIGGGNAAGYAARTFVENGMADGRLCIVTKEVFSSSVITIVSYRIALCLIVCDCCHIVFLGVRTL